MYEINLDYCQITNYYIDENNTLHTYIGSYKHVTISKVMNDEQAENIIDELNTNLLAIGLNT